MKKKERLDSNYYRGNNAEFYAKSQWMARNQIKTADRVAELLDDEKIGGPLEPEQLKSMILLDLGCGSGFSTLLFEQAGFRVVGLDLSWDMLKNNMENQKYIVKTVDDDTPNYFTIYPRNLINADITALPLRPLHQFSLAISISALNFILKPSMTQFDKKKILKSFTEQLHSILQKNGRFVAEFYPKDDQDLFLSSFSSKFSGGMVIDNPGLRKEQKFLLLKKKDGELKREQKPKKGRELKKGTKIKRRTKT